MLVAALLAVVSSCQSPGSAPHSRSPVVVAATDSTLQAIFARGITFAEFVDKAVARREGWLRLQRDATISPALLARARRVGGSWQLLVIAVDACGDSMNSVPYAARLAALVPGLTMHVVLPEEGRAVQAVHRSLDGRTATPTFVLLDSAGRDVGCVVELPAPLRQWTNAARGAVSDDSLHAYRHAFYARDRGASISTELVELLESARAGAPKCDRA